MPGFRLKSQRQIPPAPLFSKGGRGDFHFVFFFALLYFLFPHSPATAGEWSGYISSEARLFFQDPLHEGQREQSLALAAQPEYYHAWKESSFTAVPFLRLDSADSKRSQLDIREFFYLWYPGEFELGIGIRKVFWGVTESQHLVDIINQTDLLESPDREEKLGQAMVNLSIDRDWGTFDFFLLPYFRERTFPGRKGRLRTAFVVDTDQAQYESGDKQAHLDYALRFIRTLGDWDLALSHFQGTSRDPSCKIGTDDSGNPVFIPFYDQIGQTGLELQLVAEAWLWKLEAIHRSGQGKSYQAWTGGFEYTFTGIFETQMDLGAISEWLHDSRGQRAPSPFEDDLMAGFRLAINDMASTEVLVGLIQDLDQASKMISIEASRRITDHWKIEVEGFAFIQQSKKDFLYALRDDDFLQMTLFYYF